MSMHPTHTIESWGDHDECLRCGLNTSIGDEAARLAEPCPVPIPNDRGGNDT